MEIVFLRHGKAELFSENKPDFERELTEEGRKKMKQAAEGLACCLFPEHKVQIWTSPFVRTCQTAQLLKAAFGKRAKLRTVEAVASGSLRDLSPEWADLPEETVLIIVGHEPMISEWTKSLSGASAVFRPGSAASVVFSGENRQDGLLSWFMRVGVLGRLDPSAVAKRRKRA